MAVLLRLDAGWLLRHLPKSLLRSWSYQNIQTEKGEEIFAHLDLCTISLYLKLSFQSKQPSSEHTTIQWCWTLYAHIKVLKTESLKKNDEILLGSKCAKIPFPFSIFLLLKWNHVRPLNQAEEFNMILCGQNKTFLHYIVLLSAPKKYNLQIVIWTQLL